MTALRRRRRTAGRSVNMNSYWDLSRSTVAGLWVYLECPGLWSPSAESGCPSVSSLTLYWELLRPVSQMRTNRNWWDSQKSRFLANQRHGHVTFDQSESCRFPCPKHVIFLFLGQEMKHILKESLRICFVFRPSKVVLPPAKAANRDYLFPFIVILFPYIVIFWHKKEKDEKKVRKTLFKKLRSGSTLGTT